jgi:hypothetical protein
MQSEVEVTLDTANTSQAQDVGYEGGPWSARVYSRYLAKLPGSCGGCSVLLDSNVGDAHIRVCETGLHLAYQLSKGMFQ